MRKQLLVAVIAFGIGSSLVSLDAQGMFWALVNGQLQAHNPVGIAAGTAALPSLGFTADTDTGFYNAAANQIGVTAGGTGRYLFTGTTGAGIQLQSTMPVSWSSGNVGAASDLFLTRVAAGEFGWTAVLFASLGTPANGTFCYCSDCTIASPCAGSGTGALAKRLNGVWVCN